MNSDINKEKEKEKKLKVKKSKGKKLGTTNEIQEGMKKNSILSKLDTLDDVMKEESRVVEEKLKIGLIKSEQAEREEIPEKEKLTLNKIKKEIDNLQILKNKNQAEGNYEKAIEISKKIIVLAFSNSLKSIVNEENKFLEIIQNNIIQEPEKLDIHKEDAGIGIVKEELTKEEVIKEGVILKLREAEVQDKRKFEEEKLIFKKSKENFEQEKLIFKEEKERFEQEKREFEEKTKNLKQERLRFEEEKKAFK